MHFLIITRANFLYTCHVFSDVDVRVELGEPIWPAQFLAEEDEEFEIPPLVDYYGVPIEDNLPEAVAPEAVPESPDQRFDVDSLPALSTNEDDWNPRWSDEEEELPEQHWCQHCGNYYYYIPTHVN